MKFSAFTMISRNNQQMRLSTTNVADLDPDDYVCYIDPTRVQGEDLQEVIEHLESIGARHKMMELHFEDHYADVNRQVYMAILEAKNPWVLDCDDDDEVLPDAMKHLEPYIGEKVGAVYGHKLRHDRQGEIYMVNSWDIYSPFEVAGMRGSVILYNRDIMRRIYKSLDIFRGPVDESFGYFWEYKIAYWMTRAGYVLKSCHEPVMFQHVNRDRHEKMKSLKDAWYPMVVKNREQMSLIEEEPIIVRRLGSMDQVII